MKIFSKMISMIMLIGLCIIFYKYESSISIRYQLAKYHTTVKKKFAYGTENMQTSEFLEKYKVQEIINEIIPLAVQKINGLSSNMGDLLIQELTSQFNQILTSPSKNEILRDKKKQRPLLVKESATQSPRCVLPCKRKNSTLDPLYIITATYRRPVQIAELTRLAQTLMLVENLHWLVIEDEKSLTPQVAKLLKRTGLVYEHLIGPMPDKLRKANRESARGAYNQNRGLAWIRANATKGVFYFADDDNTYDIDLFEEIRRTKAVSMFPVALLSKTEFNSPIVKNGKYTGFYAGWRNGRKFPLDMAGFAVSVEFLLKRPKAKMSHRPGKHEEGFLRSLAPLELREMELLADNCTRILVWHTQTKEKAPSRLLNMNLYRSTNLITLKQQIV